VVDERVVDAGGVGQPERREVLQEVVPVRHRHPHLGDVAEALEHRLAHRVQRLLQREGVGGGEGLQQHGPDAVEQPVPVQLRRRVAPARGDRGGQHAVAGLGSVVYRSRGVAPELRAGGLEDDEVGQAGEHVHVVPVRGDHRRPHLAAGAAEGVLVRLPADGDPLPAVGLHRHPRAR
jgi:hypothetical protein